MSLRLSAVVVLLFCSTLSAADPADVSKPYDPKINAASEAGRQALQRFKLPAGFKAQLWAAEPLLANPVAIDVDSQGRVYVCETFRHSAGVTDTRSHMEWLDDDLAARTVDDRVKMFQKYYKDKFPSLSTEHDRLRLVVDKDGDGVADSSTVFADGFNSPATGIGAGVLARKGDVYFTCIPDLWKLRDTTGDGVADERKVLATGFGVHVGYLGHDLHGLRFGPDGKLYFSIGDRGLNVQTPAGPLVYTDVGSVLRCNPDGSDLEVFCSGLRNPQELAFDAFGNLFTCDNNCDSGDKARWLHLVEGGDTGWRIGYQFIESPVNRGPWNREKLWHTPFPGQAAYILPPLAHVSDGPSGLTAYPGTGFSESMNGAFFLCDFRGGSSNSGVRLIKHKPKGATFELTENAQFFWSVLCTDAEFGPDGALYVSDWTEGWSQPKKGRLYKVVAETPDPRTAEVQKLLAGDFTKRSQADLLGLLTNADQRVRQEAQFELVDRGATVIPALIEVTQPSHPLLARVHAMWGLAQLGRKEAAARNAIRPLLTDADAEIRAQACKLVGDLRDTAAAQAVLVCLTDSSPRVQLMAALSAGKVAGVAAVEPLLTLLANNNDQDKYLRHAAVMGLTQQGDVAKLIAASDHTSPAARMGVLLALRRLQNPAVAKFLLDAEPLLADEAARAIYDAPINGALPALAAAIANEKPRDIIAQRAIAANHRLGGADNALAVAKFATRQAPLDWRKEALLALKDWAQPNGRDRVVGVWRPIEPRSPELAQNAFATVAAELLASGPADLLPTVALVAGELKTKAVAGTLRSFLDDEKRKPALRKAALLALEKMEDDQIASAVKSSLGDRDPAVRNEARRILSKLKPDLAVIALSAVLENATVSEQQSALSTLAGMKHAEADKVLAIWLSELLANQVPAELQLDVVEAAQARGTPEFKKQLAELEGRWSPTDKLAPYRLALAGGNAENGKKLFFERTQLACLRCHKVQGQGGEVGPDLTGIAGKQNREYLLEAIAQPNAKIAKGFETVVCELSDGTVKTGIVRAETPKTLTLITAEGKVVEVPIDQIEARERGPSAMPETIINLLNKRELRDLVEYLSTLK